MKTNVPIDRRTLLGGGLAAAGTALLPPVAFAQAEGEGLHAIAKARNLRFGSAFAWSRPGADAGSFANPAFAALLQRDCGVLVPENELKWQRTRPSATAFDFDRLDPMIAYAKAAGMPVRGHTLLWHYSRWFPKWLNDYDFGSKPAAEAERLLAAHIDTVAARYGTAIYSYDVVNEAVDPDTGGMRETSLSKAMGGADHVLDHAFRTARAAAPHAELVYNDYMSWEAGNEKHRSGVLRMLEGLRKRGTPVDTLGVQSHIGISKPTSSIAALVGQLTPAWRTFLNEVTGMGYRLSITEFDVRDRGLPADIATRDRAVADFAGAYLDLMLSYPQLTDILAWGMSDKYSWLRSFEPRPDKEITRGLPYDVAFEPKPLRAAIARSLRNAPMRPAAPERAA
ncbi:endo-1,4-beta-xylanase [Sphingomonas qomolangmaensis]|uniref:Beta-xylanase n=1 Tax=Sphingomonas qomolangmaensis TaxID=2918765 RepID=A0ABY5L6I3_9SPHN|nr:endo-1,4-beta-xylanase [Sphingomonas qomolangmaensis]UUL81213.1 endo-1,4-beta-xylanase [Sphingomonas qomolangmaensis]